MFTSADAEAGQAATRSAASTATATTEVGPFAGALLRVERLREHARSIFEHHLNLLSIDYSHDVSVTKFPVPNQVTQAEGL